MPGNSRNSATFRAALWLITTAGFFFASSFFLKQQFQLQFFSRVGLEDIRIGLAEFGKWMPVIYCLLYAMRSLIYIPEPVLMMLAGFLVGPYYGILLVMIGSLLAASLGYGLARMLVFLGAEKLLRLILRKKLARVNDYARRYGFRALLAMRIMPIFPFTLLTYSSGILRLPFGRFILAMGLGVTVPAFYYGMLAEFILRFFAS